MGLSWLYRLREKWLPLRNQRYRPVVSGYRVQPVMFESLTRKIVTATESKAQAYRVGLPRPTCGVYIAYAKKSYHYGIKGTGHPAAAPTHPPGGGGVCTGRSGRASARWRALPRRAPTHKALRRPPWRARQPRLRRSVGVGRGRGLVAVYGLGKERKKLVGFWKSACLT